MYNNPNVPYVDPNRFNNNMPINNKVECNHCGKLTDNDKPNCMYCGYKMKSTNVLPFVIVGIFVVCFLCLLLLTVIVFGNNSRKSLRKEIKYYDVDYNKLDNAVEEVVKSFTLTHVINGESLIIDNVSVIDKKCDYTSTSYDRCEMSGRVVVETSSKRYFNNTFTTSCSWSSSENEWSCSSIRTPNNYWYEGK